MLLFFRLPTGFLPTEDQGAALVQFRLPAGATHDPHAAKCSRQVEEYFLHGREKNNIKTFFTVAGGGQGAAGQNTGQAFINLADYDKRKGKREQRRRDRRSAHRRAFRGLRDAQVFALVPGAIRGLGQSTGFTMELLNTGGMTTRAVRRRARPAARRGRRRAQARVGPAQRAARRRQPQGQHRPAARRGAWAELRRREQHAVGRLGRPLRQRFHRPRPRQARLCPG